MSEDGFNKDDLSSTFARFTTKRRNIVCDESKLKRKKPEPIALTSATNACGPSVLDGIANILTITPERKKRNDEWRARWEEERAEWADQDRKWTDNR